MNGKGFSSTDRELVRNLVAFTAEVAELNRALAAFTQARSLYQQVKFWAALAAAMTINLGLVLVLGGPQRISATAYSVIANYGGHNAWGAVFMTAGLFTGLCIGRFHRCLQWALMLQALPYAAIATSFGVAAIRYPDANLTAAPVYAWIMIMHGFLADYARKEF